MSGEPILVAGAGAVGSVFGALLQRAGCAVTLLGRPAHLAAIERRGLQVEGLFGSSVTSGFRLAETPAGLEGPYAAVLLTVKAYDTAHVARTIAPYLDRDGVVISLQNGLGNVEEAAQAVGPHRVVGGRVIFGAMLTDPGRVRVTVYAEPVMVGSPDPGRYPRLDARARRWAGVFAEAGIPSEYTDDIVAYLWSKVLYNAPLNPLGAVLGLTYGELAEDPELRAVMDGIIDEAYAVARARAVRLHTASAQSFRREFYGRLVPATADHRSSMLQDIERGRPTEIDAINGRVGEYGREVQVPTPLNDTVTRLVRAKAAKVRCGRT
jgi:2-dehydropantoate 2-reductase